MLTIAICSVLFILGSSDAAFGGRQQDSKNVTFDFLVLTREWPFSFCSVLECKNTELLQQKFNIHGLWPDVNNGSSHDEPVKCDVPFNKSELDPLKDDLMKYWIDLLNPSGSPLGFWKQEWFKHGSCVALDSNFNTTFLYFQAALQLTVKYNLTEILSKAGIHPSSTPVNTNDIRQAIRDNFGFLGEVRCRKPDENSMAYIYELRLCFTKDLQPRDCNAPAPSLTRRPPVDDEDEASPIFIFERALLRAAQRLLRWFGGSSGVVQLKDQGTYECNDSEMALLPADLGA